ncbi:MAG: hypothetical protein Q9181_004298 [Wetmoreana brouardii]
MDGTARAVSVVTTSLQAAQLAANHPHAPRSILQIFAGVPLLAGEANLAFFRFANGRLRSMPPLRANARFEAPPAPAAPAASTQAEEFGDPLEDQENA